MDSGAFWTITLLAPERCSDRHSDGNADRKPDRHISREDAGDYAEARA
jgi:hypothetical protein